MMVHFYLGSNLLRKVFMREGRILGGRCRTGKKRSLGGLPYSLLGSFPGKSKWLRGGGGKKDASLHIISGVLVNKGRGDNNNKLVEKNILGKKGRMVDRRGRTTST